MTLCMLGPKPVVQMKMPEQHFDHSSITPLWYKLLYERQCLLFLIQPKICSVLLTVNKKKRILCLNCEL